MGAIWALYDINGLAHLGPSSHPGHANAGAQVGGPKGPHVSAYVGPAWVPLGCVIRDSLSYHDLTSSTSQLLT